VRARSCIVVIALLSPAALAQQFQHQSGLLPGAARWSEGVECADVDHDGDLDIFFAEGDGFSSAGVKRQNILLINQFVPSGTLSFTDESVARLGVHVSNAKMVVTCDVNADGWVDALVCNAFDTDTPFLYINQGASNPGFFTMESATRGLTTAISSGGAQFGDVDNDGDPDLLISNGYLGQSRKPKLYLNDGAGFFTESVAGLPGAVNKSSQMDVQLVDLDADWDLDFFGACRATNAGTAHYLLMNDGTGVFNNTAVQVPSNSGSTYEGEVGDLDGDSDIDMFLVSSTGFAEGAIRNNFAPSGPLGFTQLGTLADSNDDNEIALFDWDVDGDYDVLVGSLSNSSETFWRNNGSLSFTNVSAGTITALTDSTLDVAVADLNNDGRYDLVTAQGESGSFVNKVYVNTGAVDMLRPVVTAIDSPATSAPTGPTVVRAKVRDQVLDDGVDYVTGVANYSIRTAATPPAAAISINAGNVSPNAVVVGNAQGVIWTNNSGATQSVQLTTAPHDYSVVTLNAGQSYEFVLTRPGSYTYVVNPAGHVGSINVSGSANSVEIAHSGVSQFRASMPDLAAGQGLVLFYELDFRDYPGNHTITPTGVVSLQDCGVTVYCTAKVNSQFCLPTISATGMASLANTAPFLIQATNILNQKQGLLFYGYAASASPFQGGVLCAQGPLRRLPIINSGGSASGTDCSGVLSVDFNARIASGVDPFIQVAGQQVNAQFWSRDPQDAFTTNLTDAVQFKVCQ